MGYLKCEDDPHKLRKHASKKSPYLDGIDDQLRKWTLSNNMNPKPKESLKEATFLKCTKLTPKYAPLKTNHTVFNTFDSLHNEDISEFIKEPQWKFGHKTMRRQKKTVLQRTRKPVLSLHSNSSHSISGNEFPVDSMYNL